MSTIQEINDPLFQEKNLRLLIKRDDLIHSAFGGNKWYKLKYNIEQAKQEKYTSLLTFGGAFSNHIYATAEAGRVHGLSTIGVIRGEEDVNNNPTLFFAKENGMRLHFVTREEYRKKDDPDFLQSLKKLFGRYYLIPEGGANTQGVKGCEEILNAVNDNFDIVCCPCGTGATLAGIARTLKDDQHALGFSVLKGSSDLEPGVAWFMDEKMHTRWTINHDYHSGGYARYSDELVKFVNIFYNKHSVPLDIVYTGKMMFGIYDLVRKNTFKAGTTLLAIHTGGLQGNRGFEQRFGLVLPR